jgi:hypothetical protein
MKHPQMKGHVAIHSAPTALRQHIEWGLNTILGSPQNFNWREQPLAAGTSRTSIDFHAPIGTAAKIAIALKNWHYLRFEVHELGIHGGDMYRCTPELGIHRASIDAAGNVLVSENQISKALAAFDEADLRENFDYLLGKPWDVALEPFRGVDLQEAIKLRAI